MSAGTRLWICWLLPFMVASGMAFGGLIGFSLSSGTLVQEGPSGDVAGAAGALLVILSLVVGFAMSAITIAMARLLRRGVPGRIGLRLGLSVVGGGLAGALGSSRVESATTAAWLLLLGVPALLSWSGRVRAVSGRASGSAE